MQRNNIKAALKLLELSEVPDPIALKSAYRQMMKRWHPDVCKDAQAEEMATRLNDAYDLLQWAISKNATADDLDKWAKYQEKQLAEWRAAFLKLWQIAHKKSLFDGNQQTRGLYLSTCITQFRRSFMEPPAEWFYGALYKPTEANQKRYREHLLEIAPNQLLKEAFAMKYWKLEFQQPWTFYPPAGNRLAG